MGSLRQIDFIFVHHSASPDVSAQEIDGWHKAQGWAGIGYHYVVRASGEIEPGRTEIANGAHCKGLNHNSIGICVTGDFTEHKPTNEQMASLVGLIVSLKRKYPGAEVVRHSDKAATECPGHLFPWGELLNLVGRGGDMFSDVPESRWSAATIKLAVELGIMGGFPDGTFKPAEQFTREQAASALTRLFFLTHEESKVNTVIRNCSPAVATVYAGGGGGSGFFVSDKLLVTNAHVVNGVNTVTIVTAQGNFIGEVERRGMVWDSKGNITWAEKNVAVDLATVRITKKADEKAAWGSGFPVVKFADTEPKDGDFLVLIGSPLLIQGWKSLGIVSRQTPFFINTDAAINPGNSGGAGFNLSGEFVGVPTYKYSGNAVDSMGGLIRSEVVRLWLDGRHDQIKF